MQEPDSKSLRRVRQPAKPGGLESPLTPQRVDVAIIGTGPLALIEGLRLADAGRDVCFLDTNHCVGGSWKATSHFGFDNLEQGVHLIENRPLVNRWLRATLEGRVSERCEDRDFGLWLGRRLSIASSRVVLHGLVSSKAVISGAFGRASRTALSARRAVQHFGTEFLYPEGGFSSLLLALTDRLDARGARICLGQPVYGIRVEQQVATLIGQGWEMSAEQVIMFSRAHAPIIAPDAPVLVTDDSNCHSLLLLVGGEAPRFDGYVEVIGDPLIKRARNVGAFARPAPRPGRGVICVQLRTRSGPIDGLAKETFAHLITLGLVSPAAHLTDAQCHSVPMRTLSSTSARHLNERYAPVLRVEESTDFADCLETRLHQIM